jgi:hypothetical protein
LNYLFWKYIKRQKIKTSEPFSFKKDGHASRSLPSRKARLRFPGYAKASSFAAASRHSSKGATPDGASS